MGWKKGVRGIVSLSNWKEGTVIYQDGGRLQEDQVWGNGRYLSHNHSEVWPRPGTRIWNLGAQSRLETSGR